MLKVLHVKLDLGADSRRQADPNPREPCLHSTAQVYVLASYVAVDSLPLFLLYVDVTLTTERHQSFPVECPSPSHRFYGGIGPFGQPLRGLRERVVGPSKCLGAEPRAICHIPTAV